MNFTATFLALALGVSSVASGQETASRPTSEPVLLAQTGRPPAAAREQPSADETITIPAPRATPRPSTAAQTARQPTDAAITTTTVWKLIQDGGWAMIPLGFLSVMTVMLVLVYLFTLRRSSILTPHYMNTADVLLKKRDYLGLLAISSRHSEAVARVVQRTLDFATKNPNANFEVIRDIAETEGSSQAASLQHRTVYLADIGMLAPMIGLLGTVFGIIRAFGTLGAGNVAQNRDMALASGVSEALVATASGLVLGIVAMGFYSLFRNRVQSLISDLEIASAHVLALIAVNFNKKRETSRVVVDEEF